MDYKVPETTGGVVTSWIPATTAFTAPTECSTLIMSQYNALVVWDPGYGISVVKQHTCHQKAITTWWNANALGDNYNTAVSLGPITCPSGYTTAQMSEKNVASTMVYYCPKGYEFVEYNKPGTVGECLSKVALGQTLTYVVNNGGWTTNTTTLINEATVYGIPVNGWVFASETTGTTATAVASCSAEPLSSSSPGAVVGIGVGVSLGVAGLASFLASLFVFIKARKVNKIDATKIPENQLDKAELPIEPARPFYASSPGQNCTVTNDDIYTSSSDARLPQGGYGCLTYASPNGAPNYFVGELSGDTRDPERLLGTHSELEGEFERNNKAAFPDERARPLSSEPGL